jgi:hypothetical protein
VVDALGDLVSTEGIGGGDVGDRAERRTGIRDQGAGFVAAAFWLLLIAIGMKPAVLPGFDSRTFGDPPSVVVKRLVRQRVVGRADAHLVDCRFEAQRARRRRSHRSTCW